MENELEFRNSHIDKIYVLYHDDLDGWGSMFAAWLYFKDTFFSVEYIKVNYNQPFPIAEENLNKNINIFILDFSYDLETLTSVMNKVNLLIVIDHHAGVIKKIAGFPNAILDSSKSGAMLTWEYFHKGIIAPYIICHVQDYDLYKFELKSTRAIASAINASKDRYSPQYWESLLNNDYLYDTVAKQGDVIINFENDIAVNFKKAKKYRICNYNNLRVALYNTTTLISRISEEFYNDDSLNIDFTMSYFVTSDGKFVFNLRSKKVTGANVFEIANKHGGNGHVNAAGFVMDIPTAALFLAELYS